MTAVSFALHLLSPVSVSPSFGFPVAHDPILITVTVGDERYALARRDGRSVPDAVSAASGQGRGEAQTALDL